MASPFFLFFAFVDKSVGTWYIINVFVSVLPDVKHLRAYIGARHHVSYQQRPLLYLIEGGGRIF